MQRTLLASGFILILVGLGAADAYVTSGTLRVPGFGAEEGVAKKPGPDVVAIASRQGFSVEDSRERNQLELGNVRALLLKDDRVATIAWGESADVKGAFTALRKRLRSAFSNSVTDLIDETQRQAGKPPRDVLSFFDPAMSSDRLLFVRVRGDLYEFHIVLGHEPEIDRLLDALTE